MLDLLEPFGGNTREKGNRSKKGTIGCHPRGRHHVFTHFPTDPMCEVCRKTQATWATWKIKLKNRVGGIAFSGQFGDFIKADQKILNVDKWFEMWTHNYSKRARGLHELVSQLSSDNKGCVGCHVVFTKILTFPLKTGEGQHGQCNRVYQSWSSFTVESWRKRSTLLRNDRSARKSHLRVKEGTAIALGVQSGSPVEWWDCAMEYGC